MIKLQQQRARRSNADKPDMEELKPVDILLVEDNAADA